MNIIKKILTALLAVILFPIAVIVFVSTGYFTEKRPKYTGYGGKKW